MSDLTLTDEERAAGWTEETLAAYVKEREEAQHGVVTFNPEFREAPRPRWANNRYDVMRFGR